MVPFTFYDWLGQQTQRNDAVGSFARHAHKDKLFPRNARRLHIFLLRYEGLQDLRTQAKKAHAEWRHAVIKARNGNHSNRNGG